MIETENFSEKEYFYNFDRYENDQNHNSKNFKQILDFLKINKSQKKLVLPKYFSFEQDRKIRNLMKKFKKNPFQNILDLTKTYSHFLIQNNQFLLKTFIKINDSIFLELLKIFNFYSSVGILEISKTYFEIYVEPYFVAGKYAKNSVHYGYNKVRTKSWKR